MNRARMLALAAVSLVLSFVVSIVAYNILRNITEAKGNEIKVVVAAERIPLGSRIQRTQLRTVSWPQSAPLEGSFADPEELVGRGVVVPIAASEPIMATKLAPKEGGAGLSWAIPEGLRAVAVRVDEVIGVAGFVLPGTKVDVILTGSLDRQRGSDTSKVILENVQVMSAGSQTEQGEDGAAFDVTVVTLLVAPEDAQKLALAASDGRIQLALRNPLDDMHSDPAAVKKPALYGGSSVPVEEEPKIRRATRVVAPPKTVTIELIQGKERQKLTFE
ncbi:MAG TPA: Flp pilus assembly protein CpaB [Vicinamibacteria bacterium]|nr:Flp pilus assembly protein CpaB [Vicinamibacteria bacterium]